MIELPKDALEVIFNSLKPESEAAVRSRSRVRIEKTRDGLLLEFDAKDTSSLRAALNSYLRWVSMLIDVVYSLG